MNIRFLLISFALLIQLTGCVQLKPIYVKSVECCDIKKAHGSDPEVAFQLEIENQNDFDINIKCYDLGLKINGNRIGGVKKEETSVLNANSVLKKEVSIKASTQKLIGGTLMMGLNALFKNDPTTLEIEIVGSVVVKVKGITKRVKIREKYPLQMHP
ncbi:MAG: hypothetical protein QF371_08320 [Flavobacteriales bacterium]|jgi:LEA14-like dessication related protein|nr:hypothetical protein [Flavobacteriales bacterium]